MRTMVILESPFAKTETASVDTHKKYLKRCLLDSLSRNEAPIASHQMYTGVLDDTKPDEREIGIGAGLAWRSELCPEHCHTVVYIDYGITGGMALAIANAVESGVDFDCIEFRVIGRNSHPHKRNMEAK